MSRDRPILFAVNGGAVSPLALARVDLQRMRITAEEFHNCFPRVIGPLSFRPGLEYLGTTPSNAVARQLPFIFSAEDTALIELSNLSMRPLIDGAAITRVSVATTIQNGDFASGTGWTLATGADINTTVAGALVLTCAARGLTSSAKISSTVAGGDQSKEHAVRIIVTQGAPRFKIGTTSGGGELVSETELLPGIHSVAFTPGVGTVYFEFNSQNLAQDIVTSATIEAAGELTIATPWLAADLYDLRHEQSGDVIFVAHASYHPKRIERRATRSWSLVDYLFKNGPWRQKPANVTLTPSVRTGVGTLTASAPFFTASHVGCLFELTHTQSVCSISLAGNDVYTDWLRVSGPDQGLIRIITTNATGTYVGTVTVQFADAEDGPWMNRKTIGNETLQCGDTNQITFARAGFQAGDYTSGTAVITLTLPGGGGTGVVRVTGFTSSTVVTMEVVERLHYTGATADWREGKYSNVNSWPSAVTLFEGRLWWGGRDQLAGSVSDSYNDFDTETEGDSGPVIRSIATGPVNRVQWLLGLARLVIGTSGAESVARSSSFDEPMSPTNFSIKDASTYGSSDVQAVKVDRTGFFVHRNGKQAYQLAYSIDAQDYTSNDISRFNPTILSAGVKIMAVQRQPDARIWFGRNDGMAAVLVNEPAEDVISWCTFETAGTIEDICVLPNVDGDDVHMIVNRTINGSTVRYREKLAYDFNAEGGTLNRVADSFKTVAAVGIRIITGLNHLEGKGVVVWTGTTALLDANGDPQLFTVSGGQIDILNTFTGDVTVGLPYEGRWKSTKLAYAAQTGTAVTQKKIINRIAPLLYNTHNRAVLFGQSFDKMNAVPRVVRGVDQGLNTLLEDYDADGFTLPGKWETDARLHMKFRAPLPATVLGVVMEIESHERA